VSKPLQVWALSEYTKNGEQRTRWTLVGAAFKNQDDSLSIVLDCVPLSGKLQVRKKKEGDEDRQQR
jgi:hypothetical protein